MVECGGLENLCTFTGPVSSNLTGGPGAWGSLPTYVATYGYGKLNRLTSASDTGWSRSFGYDENGNMWLTGNSGANVAGNAPTSNVFNASNWMAGNTYDVSGNQMTVNGDTVGEEIAAGLGTTGSVPLKLMV